MPSNIAARRGAKAQRRKAVVALKRKLASFEGSMTGQIRSALTQPIQACLMNQGTIENGSGTVVLARGASPVRVTVAGFMLDTLAEGITDVLLRTLSGSEFSAYVKHMALASPMVPVEPSYARKLLHKLVDFANAAGFPPHPDYPAVEQMFGSVDAAACDTEFTFGRDGKPVIIADASEEMELVTGEIEADEGLAGPTIEGEVAHGAPEPNPDQSS
jgi:hypothetical protein